MEVGAGGALVEEVLEVVVVGAVVDRRVHDVHEGGCRGAEREREGACGEERAEEERAEEDRGLRVARWG